MVNYALEVAFIPVRALFVFFAYFTHSFSYGHVKYSIVKVYEILWFDNSTETSSAAIFVVLSFIFLFCNMNFEIYFVVYLASFEIKSGGKQEDKPVIIFLVQIVNRMFPVT